MNKIWAFLQGWFRYFLYYSEELSGYDLKWLIKKHIRQQIDMRIASMNPECYNSGSCIKCNCATTALQMANKACDGGCYPKMLGPKQWKDMYKYKRVLFLKKELWVIENEKFVRI